MRGEHRTALRLAPSTLGSSPHARGTLNRDERACTGARFIPACAGNTRSTSTPTRAWTVHPRMRGEHVQILRHAVQSIGSSPHARGTLPSAQHRPLQRRFIPACAGNTAPAAAGDALPPVHPRMRGEHICLITADASCAGSSPHARGTRARLRRSHMAWRFIPACAGNTGPFPHPGERMAVHPRMRGEHRRYMALVGGVNGSSPHARGTHRRAAPPLQGHRFIPACAGNTWSPLWRQMAIPVHPRMRGEHAEPDPIGLGQRRFIPACAGNTTGWLRPAASGPVHPRMRGEHARFGSGIVCGIGSSPHARVTRRIATCRRMPPRFIPACAGNTDREAVAQEAKHGSSPHARGTHWDTRGPSKDGRFIPACAGNTSNCNASRRHESVHPRMRGEHS